MDDFDGLVFADPIIVIHFKGFIRMGMNILIVDDSKETRREIIRTLRKDESFETFFEAGNGVQALRVLSDEKVDLILTDVIMPEMDGFKLIETIRKDERLHDIPMILLTVRSELEDRVKGLELGAWDFLVKPVHPIELNVRVTTMLRLKGLQDKLKNRIRQLERLSIIDELTGLYNKKYLVEFLRREENRSQRFGFMVSCIMMDVDHFKKINDTYGHLRGDRVLKELGILLGEMIRSYDFAARYGGDEFTLVLPQQKDSQGALDLANRIRKAIETHSFGSSSSSRRPLRVTVSMGVTTVVPGQVNDPEKLLEQADKALYKAKAEGRNRIITL
ncbi:MAG TPA: diguanylate cyclase [Nitrospiria bacterium]|nr:diguanylate cyclase [Nitrospiria bacterium]